MHEIRTRNSRNMPGQALAPSRPGVEMAQSQLDLLGELGRLETGKTLQRGLETGHSLLLMTIRPMPQTGVKVGLRQQGSPRPGCWHGNLLDHLPE
ncbi:MAG: hypothetical protein V3U27_04625, partial [Candidatus Tectomicrobia bacterium]